MATVNPQPLQFEDPAIPVDDDDDDDDDGGDDDAMDELEDANVNSVNVTNAASVNYEAVVAMPSRTSELTLSFEGEVYVFPAVTPQKVILLSWRVQVFCFVLSYYAMIGVARRFVSMFRCNWLGTSRFR